MSSPAGSSAEAIIADLAALPGTRRITAPSPIVQSVLVAGIELAVCAGSPSESSLRRLWRDRHGNGTQPLLLLADDHSRPGCVRALGTGDGAGPLRTVDADALRALLRRVSGYQRLEAIREVAAELERLDQAGIPGLRVRGLLTAHTLDVRLRRDPSRWTDAQAAVSTIGRTATWQEILSGLGYELDQRRHRGYVVRRGGQRVAVVHPKADPADFARLGSDGRPPEGALLNDCEDEAVPYGILASGGRLRLFEVRPELGSASSRYIELDSESLQDDDRPFLALLGPASLGGGDFQLLQREARAFGAELRSRLDETIRQHVLPTLAKAFSRWAATQGIDVGREDTREEFERAALTLVFRALFLLYAESANFLPMDNRVYRQYALSSLVSEAQETRSTLSPISTSLWDRFGLLVRAMRNGNPAWGVPAYDGDLFAAEGFDGAATLERIQLPDPEFAGVLLGLGRDPATGTGIDYSTIDIGHLGHIYEGLLSLRLSVADAALRYDARKDAYRSPDTEEIADVVPGDLMWQTQQGGRKGGGVYYTRSELVRHLVREAVATSFAAHLAEVRDLAGTDPGQAAAKLFDFAVLDPACGSAHFLVTAAAELADQVVRFLANTPLPEVRSIIDQLRASAMPGAMLEDVALLRRLVLKRCIFGVDVSPMGAEVAKLSLWLASFVPGLSLAYLDRNVIVGNSLIGVARPETLVDPGLLPLLDLESLRRAAEAARRVAEIDDRNPAEFRSSRQADAEVRSATRDLERVCNLWTAEAFDLGGARTEVQLRGNDILAGATSQLDAQASALADEHEFLHWPIAFPRVFAGERPGFDVVIGNPPWEEVTVEDQSFYALFRPGIRRGLAEAQRAAAVADLIKDRPDLPERLEREKARASVERRAFRAEYSSMVGDPDLYKFFCRRYADLLRDGGRLGVVLPRVVFISMGSSPFRSWLFSETTCERIDFLINQRRWMFDTHAQFTVALVSAVKRPPADDYRLRVAGPAKSLDEWERQAGSSGMELPLQALGPGRMVPLLDGQAQANLLAKLGVGSRFPFGSRGRWRCFPVRELDETNDKALWKGAKEGRPLWKGESIDQYNPHGGAARVCPETPALLKKVRKPRPGTDSALAAATTLDQRRAAVIQEIEGARVAFGDVTQKNNSRTVIGCLVPPRVLLANSAPYLAFVGGDDRCRAACIGIMNSLPFDWQARRFAEMHLNYFILEGLVVPDLDEADFAAISDAAARLSCTDGRFADFARSAGVDCGPLTDEMSHDLRIEIDARVARAWGVTEAELDVLFADFTQDALPIDYRNSLRNRLVQLS